MAIWAALTFAFAALLVLVGSMGWSDALGVSAVNWIPWVALTPLIFWLAGRFPLERGHLVRSIPVHFVAALLCTIISLTVTTVVFSPVRGGEPGGPGGLGGPDLPGNPRNLFVGFLGPLGLRGNFDLAIYLIVMTAAHALGYYRRAQERDRQALQLAAGLNQARLDALRLQLQPHFLFNTLNAISTLVHRDANAADELIGDLSDLLRASLENNDHEVPLAREIELLDRYLAIEQTRLGDRLRIVREIDPAASAALVPTFLLQPLAENAVRHGLEPRLAPGTLTIRARREGDELHLSVTDDGVGLGAAGTAAARHGIGISNTKERLRTLHHGRAGLALVSLPEGGVRVEVMLPFVTERTVVGAAAPA